MPQIIVTAHDDDTTVTMRERVNPSDFESERFAANLVERLGWAVDDATEVEYASPSPSRSRRLADASGRSPANARTASARATPSRTVSSSRSESRRESRSGH